MRHADAGVGLVDGRGLLRDSRRDSPRGRADESRHVEGFPSGRPLDALVAPRLLDDGRLHLDGFGKPLHGDYPQGRSCRKLGVVGVPDHECLHGLHLLEAVGPHGRDDGRRVLRAALFGEAGGLPSCPARRLPRRHPQFARDGRGRPGRPQNRRHPLWLLVDDGARLHGRLLDRLRRDCRLARGGLHGLLPLPRHHARRVRRDVLRARLAGGRRPCRARGASRAQGEAFDLPGLLRCGRRLLAPRHPARRAVVGGLEAGLRAGRRRLYRPAHHVREERGARRRRHALLQFHPLRDPPVAVVYRGLLLARRFP